MTNSSAGCGKRSPETPASSEPLRKNILVPWYKGKLERFQGTINHGLVQGNPGTTFSNIWERDDYDSSRHADRRQPIATAAGPPKHAPATHLR